MSDVERTERASVPLVNPRLPGWAPGLVAA